MIHTIRPGTQFRLSAPKGSEHGWVRLSAISPSISGTKSCAETIRRHECVIERTGGLHSLPKTVEREIEEKELTEIIDRWLRSLDGEDRILFVRRYWNGIALKELAKEQSVSPGQLAQRMYRLRLSLKAALEREGVHL